MVLFSPRWSKHSLVRRLDRSWRLAWASPNTVLGLALGVVWLMSGARMHLVNGVLEFALPARSRAPRGGPWRLPFAAVTLGHVVLALDPVEMIRWRAHERVHVAQYERWGPLFLPAYLGSSFWQWLRGRDAYWDNRFELEARRGRMLVGVQLAQDHVERVSRKA